MFSRRGHIIIMALIIGAVIYYLLQNSPLFNYTIK